MGRVAAAVALLLTLGCGGGTSQGAPDAAAACAGAGLVLCPGRGFFVAPFPLAIRWDGPGAVRVTLDGSDPRTSPAAFDAAPVLMIDPSRTDGRAINGTPAPAVIVRAVALATDGGGAALSPVVTETYVFPAAVVVQGDTSGGAAFGSTAMDPTAGADPAALRALPTLSVVLDPADVFAPGGVYGTGGIERPASLELVDPSGPGWQIDCGLEKAGDHREQKQSLTIHFRQEYGAGHLHAPLFGDLTVSRFDVLRLRTSGQDKWTADGNAEVRGGAQLLRDEYGRRSQRAMGWDAAIGGVFHLYLDGVYWGLYDVIERPDEDFAVSHFGGDKADYDYWKDRTGLMSGTPDAWNAMTAVGNLGDPAQYAAIQEWLDVTAFADYTLLQIYGGNGDWPGRNWVALRKSRNRAAGDIQFRFFIWDYDATLRLVTADNSATPSVADLQAKLAANDAYRQLFASRVRLHLQDAGGALTPEVAAARYREPADAIDSSIPLEAARWGDHVLGFTPPELVAAWHAERDRLLDEWFPQRTDIVLDELAARGLAP